MGKLICLFAIAALLVSCNRKDCGCVPPPPPYLNATVVETNNADCGRPVVEFENEAAIKQITQLDGTRYVLDRLPSGLNVAGKKLRLLVNVPTQNEEFVCTTVGPTYPHLKLFDAKAQ